MVGDVGKPIDRGEQLTLVFPRRLSSEQVISWRRSLWNPFLRYRESIGA